MGGFGLHVHQMKKKKEKKRTSKVKFDASVGEASGLGDEVPERQRVFEEGKSDLEGGRKTEDVDDVAMLGVVEKRRLQTREGKEKKPRGAKKVRWVSEVNLPCCSKELYARG